MVVVDEAIKKINRPLLRGFYMIGEQESVKKSWI